MKTYLSPFLFIALLFWECQPTADQKSSAEKGPYQSQVDSARLLIAQLMEDNQTPGMALAVSVNREMVWSEGFGHADLENDVHVDPSKTMFRIGSVSKTLTAAAVGLLVDEGKLDPNQSVQTYVPYFPSKKYPITVKQVAGHIAGIRHYRGEEFLNDRFYPTVKEGLEIFRNDTLLFEPGTDYSYSSYGWNLISAVIEGASDDIFLHYMQRNVFDALGMKNTMPDIAGENIPNRTKFYVIDNGEAKEAPYVDNSYKWAGGGFIGTAEDLIIFGHAHMSRGYISRESLEILQQSQYLTNGDTTNYGMGWSSGIDERGYSFIGHSGGSVGGVTQFWMYPEHRIIVAMVSNSSPLRYGDVDSKIAWLFIERE